MSKRKREIDFHVYLSEEENEVLNKFCKVMKTDRSKIIRAMILGTRLVEAPPVDYKHFIIELRRVGTNLNQLTAKANTIGFINRAECRVVLNDVRTLEANNSKYFNPDKGGLE